LIRFKETTNLYNAIAKLPEIAETTTAEIGYAFTMLISAAVKGRAGREIMKELAVYENKKGQP
jgi:hypothetical protein